MATLKSTVEIRGGATIDGNSAIRGGGMKLSRSRQDESYLFWKTLLEGR